MRYSAEEIRFNLLAIGRRPLPIWKAQLEDLMGCQTKLLAHLQKLVPDWKLLREYVPANDSTVTHDLFLKVLQSEDPSELLALKKAIERDIALLKRKISDEEDKISEYMVSLLSFALMENYVTRRRKNYTYTEFIRCMLRKLAERDLIRPLIS